jgi:trimeric autotransporter adhesin
LKYIVLTRITALAFLSASVMSYGQISIPASGIINTVAGNGTNGYSGDGGLATSAEIAYPPGMAVDSFGNIYIADTANNRIRKVTASTGDISTVAGNGTAGYSGDGGLATSAKLNWPESVAVDTSGNLYIADTDNNRVRKVTASTGYISTVAGTGAAGDSGNGGLACGVLDQFHTTRCLELI